MEWRGAALAKVASAWNGHPVSPLPLVAFRLVFGLLAFAGAVRFVAKGWVEMLYLEPEFLFTYAYLDWIRPLPGNWLYLVFGVQAVSALLIAAGRLYRPAAVAYFVSFTYVELLDKTTYLNHYVLVSFVAFLLIFLPLDRWGRLEWGGNGRGPAGEPGGEGRAKPREDEARSRRAARAAPGWIANALRIQIGIVYLFAGLAKLNPDWLFSALPLRIWLSSRTGTPLLGALFDEPWVAFAMSWGGAAFDLSIPFLLSWKRTRPWAYLAVVGFHGATALLFPIGMFPWIMIGATLVFFEGDELARVARVWRRAEGMRDAPARNRACLTPEVRLIPCVRPILAAFFAIQLFLPLRHLAYPGDVLWTEEGYRFSWRVMLLEKAGMVLYRVTDPASGRSWDVSPGDHLTMQQAKQMAFQPDMILDFAHHLAERLADVGMSGVEIRADAYVSVNGRPGALLVDPRVDLARMPRGLAPKGWILPAPGARPDLVIDSEDKLSGALPL
ncbi:MAG: HTTM domain-containing protein [Gemmatimonadota bacterium]